MARRRVALRNTGVALALAALSAFPLAAQTAAPAAAPPAANVVTPTPAPAPDTVGPAQLRDFTLPGTITRQTDPLAPSNSDAPPPATIQPSADGPAATKAAPSAGSTRQVSEPARSVTIALPPPDSLARRPTLAPPLDENSATAVGTPTGSDETLVPPSASITGGPGGRSLLPWLVALLAIGGAGAAFAWRRRNARELAYAGAADPLANAFVPPPPAPAPFTPRVAQPVASPAPAPPHSIGVVSTRLRPWIELEFMATRAVITDDTATVHFDIILYNSGSAPAREVLIEGRMFNAGSDQDREIVDFFDHPVAKGNTIAQIPPLSRVELKSAVSMPRASMMEYQVDGRRLFVPLVGFNTLYRAGASEGQTSASYIVGRGGEDGGKMAPLRLDLGPRIFRGLGARQHSVGVRR